MRGGGITKFWVLVTLFLWGGDKINLTVADPRKTIRGGAEFEIFSVRGGGGLRPRSQLSESGI